MRARFSLYPDYEPESELGVGLGLVGSLTLEIPRKMLLISIPLACIVELVGCGCRKVQQLLDFKVKALFASSR